MKTPFSSCPASHSMDTDWFAVDANGKVGMFFSSETGAVPNRAFADREQSGELVMDVAAQAIQARASEVKWRRRASEDSYEVALVAAKKPVFGAHVKSGSMRLVSKAPLALYAPIDELDDEEALEEMLSHEQCLGYLYRDDLATAAGFAEYLHPGGEATGEYSRLTAPGKQVKLAPALEKKLAKLTLPIDFAKSKTLELWKYVDEAQVFAWESGLPYDGVSAKAREAAAKPRRLEYVGGGSNKFWEVWVEGETVNVRFGRIGTDGQQQAKRLADPSAAVKEAEAQAREKLAKGYLAVTEGAAASAKWVPCTLDAQAFLARYGAPLPRKHRVLARSVQGEGFSIDEAAVEFADDAARSKFISANGLEPESWWQLELPEVLKLQLKDGAIALHSFQPASRAVRFIRQLSTGGTWLHFANVDGELVRPLRKEAERQAAARAADRKQEELRQAAERGDLAALRAEDKATLKKHVGPLLDAAVGQWKVFDFLRPLSEKHARKSLQWALESFKPEEVIGALKRGADPSRLPKLVFNVEDTQSCKALLAAGMRVDVQKDGLTPLHLAHAEVLPLLVKAGLDLEAKSKGGNTPLAEAAAYMSEGAPARVKALLALGANPNVTCEGEPLVPRLQRQFKAALKGGDIARMIRETLGYIEAAQKRQKSAPRG